MIKKTILIATLAALTACGTKTTGQTANGEGAGQKAFGREYIEMTADTTIGVGTPKRPPVEQRLFRSDAIEQKILEVKELLRGNPYLAWMFENCFPNTLETTVHYRQLANGDDDTFV